MILKTKYFFLLITVGALFLTSCEEKDLSSDNPPLSTNNIQLVGSFIYDGGALKKDSLLTDVVGNQFFIDEVKVLLNNVYVVSSTGDTLEAANERFLITTESTNVFPLRLEPGGYSARCVAKIGLDSTEIMDARLSNPGPDDPLSDPDVNRSPIMAGYGYNHLIIKGRILDVTNPDDSTGSIPMNFQIGTERLDSAITSDIVNFRVESNRTANFIFVIDVGKALTQRDVFGRPIITSDASNAADFNAATEIMAATDFLLF